MKVLNRYSSAINSSNLKSEWRTTWSDSDVIAAMGIASKQHPLGAALMRLFVDGKPNVAVGIMANMAWDKSDKKKRAGISYLEAQLLATKVLAWYRYGTCTDCGGTGKQLVMEPKPHLGEDDCASCHGTGRRPFDASFSSDTLELARWLRDEVGKHQALGGIAAMRAIAPMLDM